MNSKIKNYVDVLFKDIPSTKKAKELKEELLSTLSDHFEAHIAEGKSENQAYTESLAELGDIDELLNTLEPEKELKGKIDAYRRTRARNTSISVMLYIISVVFVIGFASIAELFESNNTEKLSIIGIICMFLCIAAATGLLIYTHMSMPQDVSQYISRNNHMKVSYNGDSKVMRNLAAFMKIYWCIVLIIYLAVSFSTGKWYITWLIWVIATAVKNAIFIYFDADENDTDDMNNKYF